MGLQAEEQFTISRQRLEPSPDGEFPRIRHIAAAAHYYGFISYSHRDSALVLRLHRELEQYRVPQRLVGKPSPVTGVIPRRLQPIFLDREEGSDQDEAALHESRLVYIGWS